MTQEERWMSKWQEIISFIEIHNRRPSKYAPEERNAWNWLRHNQKVYNKGMLRPERMERFRELLALCEQYHHKTNMNEGINDAGR